MTEALIALFILWCWLGVKQAHKDPSDILDDLDPLAAVWWWVSRGPVLWLVWVYVKLREYTP